jgi:TPR repeat protein
MKRIILAAAFLALLGSTGVSWSADFKTGLDAAKSGDYASAHYNLSVMYDKGQGVPQDYKTAVKWYTLAAEQGYASAQYNLGVMYDNGQGVPQDFKTAVKWYTLAAEQGYASAQNNLGVMYHKGQGVPHDDKTAVKWFRKGAEQGDADAQINLGLMYHKGQGVAKDYVYGICGLTLPLLTETRKVLSCGRKLRNR